MSPLMTGEMSYSGPDLASQWSRCLDMYLWLQQQVDTQIGRVLDKLASRPEIDRNTVVVFTSDHGEYAGSRGLRGKGAAAYDESIRVPLFIRDPHGRLTPKPGDARTQFTSSVDLAPLLLTIGYGGNGWRGDARYSYLAGRADIAAIAGNPTAPGRPWIAHVTDDHGGRRGGHAVEVADFAGGVRNSRVTQQYPDLRAKPHRGRADPRGQTGHVLVLEAGRHGHRHVSAH